MRLRSGLADKMKDGREGDESQNAAQMRITVIGAGVAGLTAAYRLTRPGFAGNLDPQVFILERASRAGGVVSTYELEDYTLELGPDMFQTEKPEAIRLCEEIGLAEYVVPTNEAMRRTFIAQGGMLHPLPDGFQLIAPTKWGPFFNSSLLTTRGKLRMAMDLFIGKKSGGAEESLAEFVRRRFGQEALERIAQPMLGGIYTADPELLSLRATMPRFLDLEEKHGSVIRGLMAEKKAKSNAKKNGDDSENFAARYGAFVSLKRGLGMMVERLVSSLPADSIHFHCPVVSVERGTHGKPYDVIVSSGTVVPSDAVVISSPAFSAADMLEKLDAEAASVLRTVKYSSCAVMNLIYNRADIPHALDGFGFVVPAAEKRTIMACSFASVKFPGRCPPEKAVLRIFAGGALQQDVFELSDEQVECLMWEDLHTYLNLKSVPLLSLITRHANSMPLYNVGYGDLIGKIRDKLSSNPGIILAGSAYDGGVGIPDCIRSGETAAKLAVELLKAQVAPEQ